MAKKKEHYNKIKLTDRISEYFRNADITGPKTGPRNAILDNRNKAKYNYYGGRLLGSLDQDALEDLRTRLSSGEDREEILDQFISDYPDFQVPTSRFNDILGEDGTADYVETLGAIESKQGVDTSGTGNDSRAFGARSAAAMLDASDLITITEPDVNRTYRTSYDGDTGEFTETLVDLNVNRYSKLWEDMEKTSLKDTGEKRAVQAISTEDNTSNIEKTIPELKKGISFTNYGNNNVKITKNPGVSKDLPKNKKLRKGLDNTDLLPGGDLIPDEDLDTEKMPEKKEILGSFYSGAGDIIGEGIDILDQKSDGTSSVGGAIAKGAGAGAAVGAMAGPIGAAVGGVIGGAVSGIGTALKNKKIKAANKELEDKKAIARTSGAIQVATNTQAPMYEFGTAAAEMSQPVEVEKDELVLRKNPLGKFKVVADFKGGKSHEQGGEDYVLKEGDIVFPGKKRKQIRDFVSTGNHAAIETERLKLPKDLPADGEMARGTSGDSRSIWSKMFDPTGGGSNINIPKSQSSNSLTRDWEFSLNPPRGPIPFTSGSGLLDSSWMERRAEDGWEPFDPTLAEGSSESTDPQGTVPTTSSPKIQERSPEEFVPFVNGRYINREDVPTIDTKSIESRMADREKGNAEYAIRMKEQRVRDAAQDKIDKKQARKDVRSGSSNTLGEVSQYFPGAANMLRGLRTPEKVDRNYISPETVRYTDQSAGARRDADIQSRIDMENASRFSGGSAQVARAGKAMASGDKLKRKQEINAQESARATQIEAGNVGIRNQAKAANLDLDMQYDQMDAQNRAAVDAYMDQGLHDIGRAGSQIAQDRKAEGMQRAMMELMSTDKFYYDAEGNRIKYKGNEGISLEDLKKLPKRGKPTKRKERK